MGSVWLPASGQWVCGSLCAGPEGGAGCCFQGGRWRGYLQNTPLQSRYNCNLYCIVTICTGISTGWYQPTLEPYVREQFSLTPTQASLLFLIDGGVYAVVTPIVGRLLHKGLDC